MKSVRSKIGTGTIKAAAHTIKGASANVHAQCVSTAAKNLEMCAQNEDWLGIYFYVAQLEDRYSDYREELTTKIKN